MSNEQKIATMQVASVFHSGKLSCDVKIVIKNLRVLRININQCFCKIALKTGSNQAKR